MPGEARIIDRGRGPELAGTRITVYRIMDFLRDGYPLAEIAGELGITDRQVRVALEYIEEHRSEVEAEYDLILRDVNQPNPSWVDEVLAKDREELRRRIMGRRAEEGHPDRPVD